MSTEEAQGISLFKTDAEIVGRGREPPGRLSIAGKLKYVYTVPFRGSAKDKAQSLYNELLKNPDPSILGKADKEVLFELAHKANAAKSPDEKNKIMRLFALSHASEKDTSTQKKLVDTGSVFFHPSRTTYDSTYLNSLSLLKSNLLAAKPPLSSKEIEDAEKRFENAYFTLEPWEELTRGKEVAKFTEADWIVSETLARIRYGEAIRYFQRDILHYTSIGVVDQCVRAFERTVLSKNPSLISRKIDDVYGIDRNANPDWNLNQKWFKESASKWLEWGR